VAIAAQQDKWFVRSVIIWNKLNPMPESCKDRPTESHEYILLLTKSAHYYWDIEAVREPLRDSTITRYQYDVGFHDKRFLLPKEEWVDSRRAYGYPQKRGLKTKGKQELGEQEQHHGQDIISRGAKGGVIEVEGDWLNDICPSCGRTWRRHFGVQSGKTTFIPCYPSGRNLRSVWSFSTESFSGAHFATFPRELPKRCILAATSEKGNCSKCGKPWVRITEKGDIVKGEWGHNQPVIGKHTESKESRGEMMSRYPPDCHYENKTLGWQPQCRCDANPEPALVLDPFSGSGTVGEVAKSLGRKAILIDISAEYCKLAQKRVEAISLPLKGIEC